MSKKRSLKIRTKISKTLTGKFTSGQHPNYKPEIHILEIRICGCPDHESFECETTSPKKYIKGHHMKGKLLSKEIKTSIAKTLTGKHPSKETLAKESGKNNH